VALLAARLGVEEVVGEDTRIALVEPERPQAAVDVLGAQLRTSGRGFTMPTPSSRLVSATASARAMIARETSASGSASTIGSPSSASAPSRGSNGIRASSGASTYAASASPPPEPKSSSREPSSRVR
jgi:hypothetical protein